MSKGNDTKERLLQSAERLMRGCESMDDVTSRAIAADSGVNQALINYHFGSKEGLMKAAMDRILEETASDLLSVRTGTGDPRGALQSFLVQMADITVRYEKYIRPFLPGMMAEGSLDTPLCIVPLFKEYFGDSRTEGECRLMACEVVTFLQMMFCRADEMLRFAGVDIRSKKDRDGIIDAQMDLFLGRE
ncbi:TetR/AcrR family transcriptional regulator [Methanomethylophilus alvi]|uniref:TetR/AcrR family transcriptional regulator n=1 Tax=Methanomethylophilus alvi TaxID=1291540 RepID=UPI0037DD4B13